MDSNVYQVYLNDKLIGTTQLDKADPNHGIVFGQINFFDILEPYQYFKEYCQQNDIEIGFELPSEKCISTHVIDGLIVKNANNQPITSKGNYIEGMANDGFEIYVVGVECELFAQEFPHHLQAYEDMLKQLSNIVE